MDFGHFLKSSAHVSQMSNMKKQTTLKIDVKSGCISHTKVAAAEMSEENQALRAEVLEAFYKAEFNYGFSSAENGGKKFRRMFPGHPATEKFVALTPNRPTYDVVSLKICWKGI